MSQVGQGWTLYSGPDLLFCAPFSSGHLVYTSVFTATAFLLSWVDQWPDKLVTPSLWLLASQSFYNLKGTAHGTTLVSEKWHFCEMGRWIG